MLGRRKGKIVSLTIKNLLVMLKIIHQYLGQWGPKSHMYDTSHTITLGAKSTPT